MEACSFLTCKQGIFISGSSERELGQCFRFASSISGIEGLEHSRPNVLLNLVASQIA